MATVIDVFTREAMAIEVGQQAHRCVGRSDGSSDARRGLPAVPYERPIHSTRLWHDPLFLRTFNVSGVLLFLNRFAYRTAVRRGQT